MNNKADIRWLAVGAIIGLVTAAYGILRQATSIEALPEGAIARVNDVLIADDVYDRAIARLGTDAEDPARRAAILERLVEDELLVQRGVELGMTESDSAVRAAILNSLVASITAEADAASPDDALLERHLADNADRFSYTARLSVAAWETDVEPTAQTFVAALRAGEPPPALDGIRRMPDIPDGMLPAEILRDYLGPAITAAAADMPDGSSAVFARRGRWLVVHVIGKERSVVTDLAPIRNRVLLDYRRTLAEEMLGAYLGNLRQRADITVGQP
jgi:hypothetical protein